MGTFIGRAVKAQILGTPLHWRSFVRAARNDAAGTSPKFFGEYPTEPDDRSMLYFTKHKEFHEAHSTLETHYIL